MYFCGLSASKLIDKNQSDDSGTILGIDHFLPIACDGMTDIEIGWDYFLIWKSTDLHISGKIAANDGEKLDKLLQIPEYANLKFKQAIAGSDSVTVLTDSHDIWIYNIYGDNWKKVPDFILSEAADGKEYIIKISQGRCTVALTNLGQVFNIPISVSNPDLVQFVDVACGYDHTLLLTKDGDIYSMGMGTRGQLGHGDLEDCDEPKLIEALAGLKVVQISAGGWHNAAITNEGDLYTWGWNHEGQLGHSEVQNVLAIPTLVDFTNEAKETVDLNANKVQCGSAFTICKIDNGELWGCGSNKYGQLGMSRSSFPVLKQFVALKLTDIDKPIKDFKCREWGTCIRTT